MRWWMWLLPWVAGIPFWIGVAAVLRYYRVSDLHEWGKDDIGGSLVFWPVSIPAWIIYKWSAWVLNALDPEDRRTRP